MVPAWAVAPVVSSTDYDQAQSQGQGQGQGHGWGFLEHGLASIGILHKTLTSTLCTGGAGCGDGAAGSAAGTDNGIGHDDVSSFLNDVSVMDALDASAVLLRSVYLSVGLSVCPPACLSTCLSVYLPFILLVLWLTLRPYPTLTLILIHG